MLSTELEILYTGLECFIECWNAFYRVGSPVYMVEMLSRGLEYLSTVLECFRQSWNTLVQSWNAF
jgi:hypothetical protein